MCGIANLSLANWAQANLRLTSEHIAIHFLFAAKPTGIRSFKTNALMLGQASYLISYFVQYVL